MRLVKDAVTTYIPGNPGNPGSPLIPARPERVVAEVTRVCSLSGGTIIVRTEDRDGVVTYLFLPGPVVEVCEDVVSFVRYPASAEVPAVPASPPTEAQINYSWNRGWNTSARSIVPLPLGSFVEFTVKLGSYAALMAIGTEGMDGVPIDNFPYGMLVDTSGIYVFEDGAIVSALPEDNSPDLVLRIFRLDDGEIVYTVGDSAARQSTSDTYGMAEELFVYGLLYSAYDEIQTAVLGTGDGVADSTVTMRGESTLIALPPPLVFMEGIGVLKAAYITGVRITGLGTLTALPSSPVVLGAVIMGGRSLLRVTGHAGAYGVFTLGPLAALGGDYDFPAAGYIALPVLTSFGEEAEFSPAVPTEGYINLPFMVAYAEGVETDFGDGSITLQQLVSLGADYAYGQGSITLPNMYFSAFGGFVAENTTNLLSTGIMQSAYTPAPDHVMILNSEGALVSTITLTRIQALALMSILGHSSSLSLLATYMYTLSTDLRIVSIEAANLITDEGTRADIPNGIVWVVNLDNNASTQYEWYGFNSFFRRGSEYFGVANDGIYLLSGNTDSGFPIDALAEFAKTNLADAATRRAGSLEKYIPNVYMGVASDGKMILKVVTGDNTLYYEARSSSEELTHHRVDIGRGLRGVYWQFSIMNQDGNDFDVADIAFLPTPTTRGI